MDNFELDSATNSLQRSPTAYDNSQAPSSSDISTQIRQMSLKASLEKADSDRLKKRWYGTQNTGTEGPTDAEGPGLLERGLNALQAPAHALVGVAKYAAGKSDKGFVDTVNENMSTKGEGWGGFLESVGAPRSVSLPVGLVADFALDPVMWMTAGAEAFVPRVAKGIQKAGFEGAELAVKSSLLRKASRVASYIPGLRNPGGEAGNLVKIAGEALGSGDAALVSSAKKLEWPLLLRARVSQMGDKAVELAEKYDSVTGRNLMGDLDKVAKEGAYGAKPTVLLEDFLKKNTTWGEDFIKKVKYSPNQWFEQQKKLSDLEKGLERDVFRPLGFERDVKNLKEWKVAANKPIEEAADELSRVGSGNRVINTYGNPDEVVLAQRRLRDLEAVEEAPGSGFERLDEVVREFKNVPPEGRPIAAAYSKAAETGAEMLRGGQFKMPKTNEELLDFFEKAGADGEAVQVARSMLAKTAEAGKETGIGFYDAAMKKLETSFKVSIKGKQVPVVKKALDVLNVSTKVFALAKVPLSPGAFINAVVGNLIMALMHGVPILNPEYLKSIAQAFKFGRGLRDPAFLEALAKHGGNLATFNEKYGDLARSVMGTGLNTLAQSHLIDAAIDVAAASGKTLTKEEILTALKNLAEEGSKSLAEGEKAKEVAVTAEDILLQTAMKNKGPKPATALGWVESKGGFGAVSKEDLPNTWFAQEVGSGDFGKLLDKMKAKGDAGSEIYKALYKAATVPSTWYSSIDEAYKLGTFKFLVTHGVNAEELRTLNRMVSFGSKGVGSTIKVAGETRYLLTPEAALKGVNDMYMQYSAMPAAVQMIRSLPIIGSPFVSFPYAMSSKIAKTLAYNPAVFNKVGFSIQEFGGRKTPLEKQALADKYSFLDKPGVVKIPFFDEHPVYANLTNMIPYYSMNMLMPSERRFRDSWAGAVSEVVDKSPLFKGPVGQMLIDEVLLPHLLSEGETPQGYFGQPVWPTDATGMEKVGYTARNLGESVVPGFVGLAGALNPLMPKSLQSQAAIQAVPSFRYRSLAEATQGKNALGIQGMEPALQRTIRGILSAGGLSTTPVNLDKKSSD